MGSRVCPWAAWGPGWVERVYSVARAEGGTHVASETAPALITVDTAPGSQPWAWALLFLAEDLAVGCGSVCRWPFGFGLCPPLEEIPGTGSGQGSEEGLAYRVTIEAEEQDSKQPQMRPLLPLLLVPSVPCKAQGDRGERRKPGHHLLIPRPPLTLTAGWHLPGNTGCCRPSSIQSQLHVLLSLLFLAGAARAAAARSYSVRCATFSAVNELFFEGESHGTEVTPELLQGSGWWHGSGGSYPASTWKPGAAPCGRDGLFWETGALGTKFIAQCSIESLAFSTDEPGAGGQGSSDQRLSPKWSFWEAELMLGPC